MKGSIAIAIAEPRLRAWAMIAVRRARMEYVNVGDLSGLFDVVAAGSAGILLGAQFAGLAAARIVSFIRTAGARTPIVVIAVDAPSELVVRRPALAPLELLLAPAAANTATAPRTEWLARCVELARVGGGG